MRNKLILLVGASGSGKTTIAKELEKKGFNIIHSYTTREPREPNEWGHIFIKKAIGHEIKMNKNMIAFKNLYDYEYWATKDQYQGKGSSIYVVDPEGAKQVHENVKDAEVVTIFLMADESIRKHRVYSRSFYDTEYETEVCIDKHYKNAEKTSSKRIWKDREIFKTCKCDYVIDANGKLEDVLESIIEIIS